MKLSEAIQLGSTLQPQTYGPFSDCHGTCAMGAALECVGKLAKTTETNYKRIKKIWPWLGWELHLDYCPCCGKYHCFHNVYNLIVHLNDDHHLSRIEIANLVLQIETKANRQIEMLVPEYQILRLSQLESNLERSKSKKQGKARKNAACTAGA